MSKPEHSPLPCCWSDVNGQDCKCARRQSDQQAIAELVEALEVFAIAANGFDDMTHRNPDEVFAYGGIRYSDAIVGAITLSDLRIARALIAKHKTKAGE